MIVYVDLDGTLIHAETEAATDRVIRIFVRPGASTFLHRIAQIGEVVLLTHATKDHAEEALKELGAAAEIFKERITREDLAPIIDQFEAIDSTPGLSERRRLELYQEILPISPPGFMIDDYPVGSWMYWLKSTAIGIGPNEWIQISRFHSRRSIGAGLQAAYVELLRKMGAALEQNP